MRALYKIGFVAAALFMGLHARAQKIVAFNDEHIRYMGRIAYQADAAKVMWSGSWVQFNFTGTEVKVSLKDERGDNYFNVIIDGKVVVLHPDGQKRTYTLATGLSNGAHSVMLFKRTEWADGNTLIYGFEFNDGAQLNALAPLKSRKIEFFGDSITSGYGVEDFAGGNNSYLPQFKNNYVAYSGLTALHYDAQYHCTSKSGIGVTVGYTDMTMPELYDRLDPNDPNSKWDFSAFMPNVVVVNLFQNDASMMRQGDAPQFKARFGDQQPSEEFITEAYRKFIQSIRGKYPNAYIICALGNMDASKESLPWRGFIEKAVSRLNDKMITAHFFTYKNTPGHPSVEEQQAMADDLIKYIDNHVKW